MRCHMDASADRGKTNEEQRPTCNNQTKHRTQINRFSKRSKHVLRASVLFCMRLLFRTFGLRFFFQHNASVLWHSVFCILTSWLLPMARRRRTFVVLLCVLRCPLFCLCLAICLGCVLSAFSPTNNMQNQHRSNKKQTGSLLGVTVPIRSDSLFRWMVGRRPGYCVKPSRTCWRVSTAEYVTRAVTGHIHESACRVMVHSIP